jgi:hypothetical protein
LDKRTDLEAEVIRGYCSAVRSALTDDGHPPLAASGLTLYDRLTAISTSLERVAKRGPCLRPCSASRGSSSGAEPRPPLCGPRCASPTAGSIGRPTSSATRNKARGRLSSVAWGAC